MKQILAFIVLCLATAAQAQVADQDHIWATPGNSTVGGQMQMCLGTTGATLGKAVPCANANAPGIGVQNAGYPPGATPVTISATGTTAIVTAVLPGLGAPSKFTYLCGFAISATGTAAAGNATVTGTISGTLNYTQGVTATPAVTTLTQTFNPCVPASTLATGITINSIAAGTSGVTSVTAWGYQF